jgi:hypothetical protein
MGAQSGEPMGAQSSEFNQCGEFNQWELSLGEFNQWELSLGSLTNESSAHVQPLQFGAQYYSARSTKRS